MNRPLFSYIFFLFVLFVALFISLALMYGFSLNRTVLFFVLMGCTFELIGISISKLSSGDVKLTGGMVINILAAASLEPSQALIVSSASVLIPRLILSQSKDPVKYIFNVSQIGITTLASSMIFKAMKTGDIMIDVWLVLVISVIYMVINTFFMTVALSLSTRNQFMKTVVRTMPTPFLSAMTVFPLAAVAFVLYNLMGGFAIPLVLAILLALQIGNLFRSEYERSKVENLMILVKSLELRDPYTRGHSERTSDLSRKIAKKMQLPEGLTERIRIAALLHDVGKIGVADYILNKPDKLSLEEFEQIKEHSAKSEELLNTVRRFRNKEAKWVRHHHEHWDGTGYPDGLKKEQIPLPSRIIAAADVYDALTSERPYRSAYSRHEALQIIQEMSATVLDPQIVKILIQIAESEE